MATTKLSDYAKRFIEEITGRRPKRLPEVSGNFVKAAIGLSAVLVVLIILIALAGSPSDQTGDCAFYVTAKDAPTPVTEGDTYVLNTCVTYETVASDSRRALGLSNRPSLPWDRGMLFDFEVPGRYCMWMKDMHFSLDMIWINEKREIVAIRENVSPDTYPQSFCGPETARYVLEVNAGVVEAGDLRLGQRVNL